MTCAIEGEGPEQGGKAVEVIRARLVPRGQGLLPTLLQCPHLSAVTSALPHQREAAVTFVSSCYLVTGIVIQDTFAGLLGRYIYILHYRLSKHL